MWEALRLYLILCGVASLLVLGWGTVRAVRRTRAERRLERRPRREDDGKQGK